MSEKHKIYNKNGMALVTCLLVMVVLAMIGVGVTTDSTIEIKIAGNEKNKAVSFQHADTGTIAAPEIIEDNLDHPRASAPYIYSDNGADPVDPVITVDTKDLSIETEGTTADPHPTITIIGADNISVNNVSQPINATITISKTAKLAAGSAIQMAAGYEGKAKSSASGGAHAYFLCSSKDEQGGTISTTEIYYRHVP
jgi:Tfp pilus assembly protein PilX